MSSNITLSGGNNGVITEEIVVQVDANIANIIADMEYDPTKITPQRMNLHFRD